ncbi:hypothetical protein PVIIG_05094 [Plasmodium vivax India VII]|uniref:Uncharacterized protein n=2 Tax=Plasmodium vivax TaxID=5855 RepID=A0A0J9SKK0_PLAVI|nr:hypothetical protein PVIIG_05094 [Plasmodium vivax India VII]KMZ89132.1 hypothetical protein PVBG_03096 [Plasmodium vivax Brazil I]
MRLRTLAPLYTCALAYAGMSKMSTCMPNVTPTPSKEQPRSAMAAPTKASAAQLDAVKKYLKSFDHKNEEESINGFAQLLKQLNIKMAVFDFDLTIIGAHSGGYIDKANDVGHIGTAVTNHFKLLSKALKENGIKITVATFSDEEAIRYSRGRNPTLIAGTDMVKFSMQQSKCDAKIEKVYAYYPPYYREPRHYRQLGLDKPMSHDKSYHLKQVGRSSGSKRVKRGQAVRSE